jgi:hypothetical protein
MRVGPGARLTYEFFHSYTSNQKLSRGPDAVRGFLFEGGVRLGMSLALLVVGCRPVSFLT